MIAKYKKLMDPFGTILNSFKSICTRGVPLIHQYNWFIDFATIHDFYMLISWFS